ncbi:IclR family transcriptional regulator [Planococcus sp. ISL-109]|uniref:IclR family transcriptional regulator n=1 Tax=Planococcus sp. ISL-109 TaxID=2819166 RepID=UPI001BE932C8|nr:IclR family transcriptional regulator [Planococcus sp. ISL-109]MBT2583329.1 IclR family transcriptional regulator [Planococcus sp. ISL-109]
MEQEAFKTNYSMSSIHRVIQVLRAFKVDQPYMSLTELSRSTGISISSLQRIVNTLVYEGFLMKNEKTKQYSLGLELMFLGQMVQKSDALLSKAIPIMERLNEETKENISLNIIEGNQRRCIYNLASRHELSALTFVGHTAPLYAGASAKVLLAYREQEFIESYLDAIELSKITDRTINSKEELRKQLTEIREQGHSITYGERVKGAVSISVPILAQGNFLLGTLSVTFPYIRQEEYDFEGLTKKMKQAAQEIA